MAAEDTKKTGNLSDTECLESDESDTECLESDESDTECLESDESDTECLESDESDTECLESDESDTECLESDEVKQMYCEHCEKLFSKNSSAVGFCVNCVEYMCDICLKYHRMYMYSHTLQDKTSMPQAFYFEKCNVHKNQLIKFFCNNCEKTACAECKLKDHSKCLDVKHLSSLAEGVEESKELREMFESIETFIQQVFYTEVSTDNKSQEIIENEFMELSRIEIQSERAAATFKEKQQKIIKNFDKKMEATIARLKQERKILVDQIKERKQKFEKKFFQSKSEAIQTIEFRKSSDIKVLQSLQHRNSLLKENLNRLYFSIVQEKSSGERCKIFLSMKKAQVDIQKVKEEADALKKEEASFYLQQRRYSEPRLEFLKQLVEEF